MSRLRKLFLFVFLFILSSSGAIVLSALVPAKTQSLAGLEQSSKIIAARDWAHFAELLAIEAAGTPDLKPGNESRLAGTLGPSPLALVYLHGFSASPKEMSPVPEKIAEALQMPLYMPRLAGHGVSPKELGDLTYSSLLQSAYNALESVRKLSPQIVVIATSTGATLAETLIRLGLPVRATIYFSPNFGTYNPFSFLLTSPFGAVLARILIGADYQWTPEFLEQHKYWTTKYPSSGLRAMAEAVKVAHNLDSYPMGIPQLSFFGKADRIIDVDEAHLFLSTNPRGEFEFIEAPNHLLAGDIMWPKNNEAIISRSVKFLSHLKSY